MATAGISQSASTPPVNSDTGASDSGVSPMMDGDSHEAQILKDQAAAVQVGSPSNADPAPADTQPTPDSAQTQAPAEETPQDFLDSLGMDTPSTDGPSAEVVDETTTAQPTDAAETDAQTDTSTRDKLMAELDGLVNGAQNGDGEAKTAVQEFAERSMQLEVAKNQEEALKSESKFQDGSKESAAKKDVLIQKATDHKELLAGLEKHLRTKAEGMKQNNPLKASLLANANKFKAAGDSLGQKLRSYEASKQDKKLAERAKDFKQLLSKDGPRKAAPDAKEVKEGHVIRDGRLVAKDQGKPAPKSAASAQGTKEAEGKQPAAPKGAGKGDVEGKADSESPTTKVASQEGEENPTGEVCEGNYNEAELVCEEAETPHVPTESEVKNAEQQVSRQLGPQVAQKNKKEAADNEKNIEEALCFTPGEGNEEEACLKRSALLAALKDQQEGRKGSGSFVAGARYLGGQREAAVKNGLAKGSEGTTQATSGAQVADNKSNLPDAGAVFKAQFGSEAYYRNMAKHEQIQSGGAKKGEFVESLVMAFWSNWTPEHAKNSAARYQGRLVGSGGISA